MAKSVICSAKTSLQATKIVDRLKKACFTRRDISVLMPGKEGTKEAEVDNQPKAPEGIATGAGTGTVTGAGLGWLAGIGALAVPEFGPLIAAGPILAALTGSAVAGTIGEITGALVEMGIPECEAKRYEEKLKTGHLLISVHAEDFTETERAKQIFKAAGAEDIATSGELAVADR
jgi:hypothetical protein